MEDLRYPVGRFDAAAEVPHAARVALVESIATAPQRFRAAVSGLTDQQLDTPYREGGWTVRQVVHHVADSHMNAYIRFKLGYTENSPTIKPYDEALWAQTEDVKQLPINISLTILYAVHRRWLVFLESFTSEDWNKTVIHPEHNKTFTLWELLGMYAWHSKHHSAHIRNLREREKF